MIASRPPFEAVLFDLDDTLYAQAEWLSGAWDVVAARAEEGGGPPAAVVRGALEAVAAEGTDRGRIIDRALAQVDSAGVAVAPLVEAFRSHAPDRLRPYPGVEHGLALLRGRGIGLGLVTDGDVIIQHAKLRALGLVDAFDVVVFSDELGREHRKPDPLPFRNAVAGLGVEAETAVYVGDRPDKDVDGAAASGLRVIRVRTGEYSAAPNRIEPWADVADVAAAFRGLLDSLDG